MRITITGPRSVGKSTVSKIVAKKLNLKYYSSDEIGEKHMKEYGGLDKAIKSGIISKFIDSTGYGLISDLYKKDNFVFDLSGGSVSSRKHPEASKKVRDIANKKSIVIGLLPSKDFDESVKILYERERERLHFKHLNEKELLLKTKDDFNKFPFLFDRFCNFIVYTKHKTPNQIAEEIINKVKIKPLSFQYLFTRK